MKSNGTKHGMYGTKEYKCWQAMLDRTTNPNSRWYPKYSLLGVEAAWTESFAVFLEHIGLQPNDGQKWTVGRKDNTVGYFPGNVRWETTTQQVRNRGRMKSNKTGFTGVLWREGGGDRPYGRAVATWYEMNGTRRTKTFPAKSISKSDAIYYASLHRSLQIERLNREGAGYAEKHGC